MAVLSFSFDWDLQQNLSHLISKQLGRKDFSMENLPIDPYVLLCI